MSATQTKNRREWVKNAAIIFLSVLLVLTFFSGTIQNYSLPEVAVQYTMQDTVSSGIRVSGTVSAAKSYNILTEETRTVAEVLVRNGDVVAVGDVLVRLEDKESEELTAARDQLKALQADYDRALLGQTSGDAAAETAAVAAAEDAYNKAVSDLNNYKAAAAATPEQLEWDKAWRVVHSLRMWHGDEYTAGAGVTAETAIAYYAQYIGLENPNELFQTKTEQVQNGTKDVPVPRVDGDGNPVYEQEMEADGTTPKLNPDGSPVYKLDADGNKIQIIDIVQEPVYEDVTTITGTTFADLKPEYASYYGVVRDTANSALMDADWKRADAQQAYSDKVDAALQAWDAAKKALADKQAALANAGKLTELDLKVKKDAITKQQSLIAELQLKSGEVEITAKQAGTVGGLIAVAGEKLTAGDTVCTIQLTDTGYTVDVSLTAAQAQRVTVGSSATVSGYYWGEVPRATVSSIRNDPNTRGNRLVTLNITGSVEAGNSYNFILAETSSSYDVVVPKIAVREDNTGSFVLVVTNKSTPLGTKYFVTRVDVTVLASDDTRCAVSGEFTGWDYVVTSSSAPISAGDQVRLADA